VLEAELLKRFSNDHFDLSIKLMMCVNHINVVSYKMNRRKKNLEMRCLRWTYVINLLYLDLDCNSFPL
jgi:hypothetical protein